jgi:hypothetical protein
LACSGFSLRSATACSAESPSFLNVVGCRVDAAGSRCPFHLAGRQRAFNRGAAAAWAAI